MWILDSLYQNDGSWLQVVRQRHAMIYNYSSVDVFVWNMRVVIKLCNDMNNTMQKYGF